MTQSSLILSEQDGVTIVGFGNSVILDAYHIDEVSKELFKLIEADKRRYLVLDFSTIKMLSSQTLGVMLKMKSLLDKSGGKMVISGIDPRLYRVFKITDLQSVFEFHDNNQQATESLAKIKD